MRQLVIEKIKTIQQNIANWNQPIYYPEKYVVLKNGAGYAFSKVILNELKYLTPTQAIIRIKYLFRVNTPDALSMLKALDEVNFTPDKPPSSPTIDVDYLDALSDEQLLEELVRVVRVGSAPYA